MIVQGGDSKSILRSAKISCLLGIPWGFTLINGLQTGFPTSKSSTFFTVTVGARFVHTEALSAAFIDWRETSTTAGTLFTSLHRLNPELSMMTTRAHIVIFLVTSVDKLVSYNSSNLRVF